MWPWDVLTSIDKKVASVDKKMDDLLSRLKILTKQGVQIVKELDDLEVQVKANTDAEQSAIVLLNQLHDLIVAAGTDPAKLKALADSLARSANDLAAAVVANTPAGPTP